MGRHKHGHRGNKIGRQREKKFFHAFNRPLTGKAPAWLEGVRRATEEEDAKGCDAFIKTDVGEIPVQIKSSIMQADLFWAKQECGGYSDDIVVIVVRAEESLPDLRNKVYQVVGRRRQELLNRATPKQ